MKALIFAVMAIFFAACATMQAGRPAVSALVDLDSASVNTAYISNFDTPRRNTLDANGEAARDGIGASIAQITP